MRGHPFTALLAGVTVVFAAQTLSLGADARRVPLVVVAPLVAIAGWQLLREVRGRVERRPGPARAQVLSASAWAAALPAAIAALGMFAGPPLYVLAYMRWRGGDSWLPSLVIAALVAASAWALFSVLLNQSVPLGVFGLLADGRSVSVGTTA